MFSSSRAHPRLLLSSQVTWDVDPVQGHLQTLPDGTLAPIWMKPVLFLSGLCEKLGKHEVAQFYFDLKREEGKGIRKNKLVVTK